MVVVVFAFYSRSVMTASTPMMSPSGPETHIAAQMLVHQIQAWMNDRNVDWKASHSDYSVALAFLREHGWATSIRAPSVSWPFMLGKSAFPVHSAIWPASGRAIAVKVTRR